MRTEILIIGGGLSGLVLAERLENLGEAFLLVEARNRLGGRVLSETFDGAAFDLGPAWVWPGQPCMANLIERLGLKIFEQYCRGDSIYETREENHRGPGYASMQGSYRVEGGFAKLIAELSSRLPQERFLTETIVRSLENARGHVTATLESRGKRSVVRARRVVLALPPRVATSTISFSPPLSQEIERTMGSIPTWMAGQAKLVAVYEEPYWRDQGFSGDVISVRGPMAEIHDASPPTEELFGVFGFVGVAPQSRLEHKSQVLEQSVQQLVRLFGPKMAKPKFLSFQDWAHDPLTATKADHQSPYVHPTYGLPSSLTRLWDGGLLLGSTEVAGQFGGYLEGAVESALSVFADLQSQGAPGKPAGDQRSNHAVSRSSTI